MMVEDTDCSPQIADPARKSIKICKGLERENITIQRSSKAAPQVIETQKTSSKESYGIEKSYAFVDNAGAVNIGGL